MRCLLITMLSLAPVFAAGCVDPRPLTIALSEGVERPPRSVVVFFVDGLDETRFNELLVRGELPHIADRFVNHGVRVDRAVSSLPSITYPNAVALITGRFPGHHGIIGNRWFDRRTLEMPDYIAAETYRDVNDQFSAPTLYEILSDKLTVNVQCHTRRGATYTIDNAIPNGFNFCFGMYKSVDARSGATMEAVSALANRVRRWPSVIMTYYPGNDEIAHHFGSDSPEYAESLRNVDAVLGHITSALDRAGLSDTVCYVLCSDHGHVPGSDARRWNIENWLAANRGRKVLHRSIHAMNYLQRFKLLDPYDTVVINGAYRRAAIHLRGKGGWPAPPEQDEIEQVAFSSPPIYEPPAVEMVLTADGSDRIRVTSREGSAVIERERGGSQKTAYRVSPRSGDPLHFSDDPVTKAFAAAGWHSSREWLAATADSRYPDFVPQAVEMFDSTRAGDIVVFAASDWSFDKTDQGGHGSCLSRDMHMPVFFAGAGLPQGGHIPCARLVDIMPTIMDLLGESNRLASVPPIDGISLRGELEAAVPVGQAPPIASRIH